MRGLLTPFLLATIPAAVFGQSTVDLFFVPLVNVLATAAKLPGVKGLAVDPAGNVFFAAGGNFSYSVLRRDAATGLLTTVAGNGTPGFSGDNGPAASAQLDGVTDIAVDKGGNLYIADANNGRVRKVSNGIITTIAGGGSSFDCDTCPPNSVRLSFLQALAVNADGDLWIFNDAVVFKVVFKLSNGVMTKYLNPSSIYEQGVTFLAGAAVDTSGNLFVADLGLSRVLRISNGVLTVVAGTGKPGFAGDNGPAASAQLAGPRGVSVDADGNLYIADTGNHRIRKVSNGIITTVAGGGSPSDALGDNGPATGGALNFPFGVGVDSAGKLYVLDTLNK